LNGILWRFSGILLMIGRDFMANLWWSIGI